MEHNPQGVEIPTAEEFQQIANFMKRFPGMFPALDVRAKTTLAEVVDKYVEQLGDEVSERTRVYVMPSLTRLKEQLGPKRMVELGPMDLKEWFRKNQAHMESDWTKHRVRTIVMRALNWAVEFRLIRENVFKGFKLKDLDKQPGRNIRPEEFNAVLRHSDLPFRRFMVALKLTGARPGELRALKWEHIDWERGVAVLPDHKTKKKTKKPRVIVLVQQVLHLLAIIDRDKHGSPVAEMRRILEHAPNRSVLAGEIWARMKALGFTPRAMYRARQSLGVTMRRLGQGKGTLYVMPMDVKLKPLEHGEFVFLSTKNSPWTREALTEKFLRLREQLGLPAECRLYGCRHFFATWAIKRGINLKTVATLLGHSSVAMVDRHYCHIASDYEHLRQAAQAATGVSSEAKQTPKSVEEWRRALLDKYPKAAPKPKREKKSYRRASGGPLKDAEKIAYEAYQFAMANDPNLKTDFQAYDWLAARPEYQGQLSPLPETFRRYLNRARHFHHGAGKRKLRRMSHELKETTCQDPEASPAPSIATSPKIQTSEKPSANG